MRTQAAQWVGTRLLTQNNEAVVDNDDVDNDDDDDDELKFDVVFVEVVYVLGVVDREELG